VPLGAIADAAAGGAVQRVQQQLQEHRAHHVLPHVLPVRQLQFLLFFLLISFRDCVNDLITNRSRKCPRCGRPFDKVDVKTVYLDYEELD
jgi:hypothetical protein